MGSESIEIRLYYVDRKPFFKLYPVRDLVGLYQGMVEAGIEVGLLVIRTGYFNAAQIIVPFIVGCLLHSFKIPVGYFRFHILLGSFTDVH